MYKIKRLKNKQALELFINILENNNPKIGSYKVNDYRVTVYHFTKANTSAQRIREFYNRRRQNGLCVECGAKSDKYRCLKCRIKQNEQKRIKRIRMQKVRNKQKFIVQKGRR